MKNPLVIAFFLSCLTFISCQTKTEKASTTDSTLVSPIDSAANNAVLPPSGSPDNANNSSLADTTYKAKDSIKKKK